MAQIESLTAEAIIAMFNQGTWPQDFPIITSDINAVGNVMAVDVSMASTMTVHAKNISGTAIAAGTVVYEASLDSTNGSDGSWFSVQGSRTNANTVESTTALGAIANNASMAYGLKFNVAAYRWFRIRCTVNVTAGALATFAVARGAYATEPAPAVQTHPVTGSGTFLTAPAASGVAYALVTTASNNPNLVAGGPRSLTEISIFNPTAALIYVKLYNKVTAPTVGTDVPLAVIPVPVNGQITLEYGVMGKKFALGVGLAVTAGPLSSDVAVVAAGALISMTLTT